MGIGVSNITTTNEEKVKLLGICIDNRLNFDYCISQLCKKAEKKLHALTRVFKPRNISQRKLIVNAFIMSQFSYCPLIWMFHSRAMEHRMNGIRETTLRLIYPNQHQSFKELLEKNKTVSREIYKPLQLKFIRLKTRYVLSLQIRCLSLLIKPTILDMRQFLIGRDIHSPLWK